MGLAARGGVSFGVHRFWVSDGGRSRKVAVSMVAGGCCGLRFWYFVVVDLPDQKSQKVRCKFHSTF
jgi:hypothetical protein